MIAGRRITGPPFGTAFLVLYNGLANGSETLDHAHPRPRTARRSPSTACSLKILAHHPDPGAPTSCPSSAGSSPPRCSSSPCSTPSSAPRSPASAGLILLDVALRRPRHGDLRDRPRQRTAPQPDPPPLRPGHDRLRTGLPLDPLEPPRPRRHHAACCATPTCIVSSSCLRRCRWCSRCRRRCKLGLTLRRQGRLPQWPPYYPPALNLTARQRQWVDAEPRSSSPTNRGPSPGTPTA